MNALSRVLPISMVIHALVIGLIAMSPARTVKDCVITIDFSANDPCACAEPSRKSPPVVEKQMYPPIKTAENPVVDKTPAPSPVMSEAQAPVAEQAQNTDRVINRVPSNVPAGIAPAQALAPPPMVASVASEKTREAVYIKESFSYIRDSVQKMASYPRMARKMGWEGKVLISFIVGADGTVRDIKIVQSSGRELLDQSTVEAVKKASPFPKPPVEAKLVVPVVYRLES